MTKKSIWCQKYQFSAERIQLSGKKVQFGAKKIKIVLEKFNLVLKKINLVPKNFKMVSKKLKNYLMESMEFVVSEPVCNVIIMWAAITYEVTWSYGDLPLSSWRHCKKDYLSFSVLKLVFV